MIGIYFSGSGNTKHCIEVFLQAFEPQATCIAMEANDAITQISQHQTIVFAYPVQYSNLPKIVSDFVHTNALLWKDKKILIIATMGLFSGDGAGCLGRLLKRYDAEIIGGIHVKMPDSISDEKALKRSLSKNQALVAAAEEKLQAAAAACQNGQYPKEGLGFFDHMAGLFGQRLYFMNKTKHYSKKLRIDTQACIGCGLCASLCPMHNIQMSQGKAVAKHQCTMCYRCISRCPQQAITLLGKQIIEQCYIEKYR